MRKRPLRIEKRYTTYQLDEHIARLKKKHQESISNDNFFVEISFADLRGVDFQEIVAIHGDDIFKKSHILNCDLRFLELAGINFNGARFESTDMDGACLEGADLRNTEFIDSIILYSSFRNVVINEHTSFKGSRLATSSFKGIYKSIRSIVDVSEQKKIKKYIFSASDLRFVNFHRSLIKMSNDLQDFSFESATFHKADFRGFNLKNVIFDRSILYDVKFGELDLNAVSFQEVDLTMVSSFIPYTSQISDPLVHSLQKAKLSSEILLDILSCDLKNLIKTSFKKADLSDVDFKAIVTRYGSGILAGYDFSYSDLSRANMATLDMSGIDLSFAELKGINVKDTVMSTEQFGQLYRAGVEDFSGVTLVGASTPYLNSLLGSPNRNPFTSLSLSDNVFIFLYKNNFIKGNRNENVFFKKKLGVLARKFKKFPITTLLPPFNFEGPKLLSLLQLREETFLDLVTSSNTIQTITDKLSDKNYILTKQEANYLKIYKKEINQQYPSDLSIIKTDRINNVNDLMTKLSSQDNRLFCLKMNFIGEWPKAFYFFKNSNSYSVSSNGPLMYLNLSEQDFLKLMQEYITDKKFDGALLDSIENSHIYRETAERLSRIRILETENVRLRRQDQRWGELKLANGLSVSRELLYTLGFLVKNEKGEAELLSAEMNMKQEVFDRIKSNKNAMINVDVYFEQLCLMVEKGSDSKIKKMANLFLANEIDFVGDQNFKFELAIQLEKLSFMLQSGFVPLESFSPLQRKQMALTLLFTHERDSAKKKSLIQRGLKVKKIDSIRKIPLTTSEKLISIKALFDVFKSSIFSDGSDTGLAVFLYFLTTHGTTPIVDYFLKRETQSSLKNISKSRKLLAGFTASGLDLYTIVQGTRGLVSKFDTATLVDMSTSWIAAIDTFKSMFSKSFSPRLPLILLAGNALGKGFGGLIENSYYSLSHSEKVEDFFRKAFDIPSSDIDKVKKTQDYLDYIYKLFGDELLADKGLAGLAYGLGNKANEQSNWSDLAEFFEKVKKGKSESKALARHQGKLAVKIRKSRMVPNKRRKPTSGEMEARRIIQETLQLERHQKWLDSLPKSAESNIDLSYNPRGVWASRYNPPKVLQRLATPWDKEKNWAEPEQFSSSVRSSATVHKPIPPYFPACFNEDPDGSGSSTNVFVPKFNVHGQCSNALVVFSKETQKAINQLYQLRADTPEWSKILETLQKKTFKVQGALISSGTIKGLDSGPINYFNIGKGNATYQGGGQVTRANVFHLPESNYVGKIKGGEDIAINILDASRINATTVYYADNYLESIPAAIKVTTSEITSYKGRKDKQDVVDCLNRPGLEVNAQGGRVGAPDQLFSCPQIDISGYSDVESQSTEVHRVKIQPESEGPIYINCPNAKAVNIVYPNLLSLAETGKFFYNSEEQALEIFHEELRLNLSPYLLEGGNRFQFIDPQNRTMVVGSPIYDERLKCELIKDLAVIQPSLDLPLDDFLNPESSQRYVRKMAYKQNVIIAVAGTQSDDLLVPEAGVQRIQGNEGNDIYYFSEAYLDHLKQLNPHALPLIITNYSSDAAIDTLKFACSIHELYFLRDGNDLTIYFSNRMIIRVKDYAISDLHQHLIVVGREESAWILSNKMSLDQRTAIWEYEKRNPNFQITQRPLMTLPFYGKNTQSVLTLQSLLEMSEIALGIDPNELVFYKDGQDLVLIGESQQQTQRNAPFKLLLEDFFVDPSAWRELVLLQAEKASLLRTTGEFSLNEGFLTSFIKGEMLIKAAPFARDINDIKKQAEERNAIEFDRYVPNVQNVRSRGARDRRALTAEIFREHSDSLDRHMADEWSRGERESYLDLTNVTHIHAIQESGQIKFTFTSDKDVNYQPMMVNWTDTNQRIEGIIKEDEIIVEELTAFEDATSIEAIINKALLKDYVEKQQAKLLTPLERLDLKAFLFFYNFNASSEQLLTILNFKSADELNEFLATYSMLYSTRETRLERFRRLWEGDKSISSLKAVLWQLMPIASTGGGKTSKEIKDSYFDHFPFLPLSILEKLNAWITGYQRETLDRPALENYIDTFLLTDEQKFYLQSKSRIVFYTLSPGDVLVVRHNQQKLEESDSYSIVPFNERQQGFLDASSLDYTSIQVTFIDNDLQISFLQDTQSSTVVRIEGWDNFYSRLKGIVDGELKIDGLASFTLNDIGKIQRQIDKATKAYQGEFSLERDAFGGLVKVYTFSAYNKLLYQEEIIYHNQLAFEAPSIITPERKKNYPGCIKLKNFSPSSFLTRVENLDMIFIISDEASYFFIKVKNWNLNPIYRTNSLLFDNLTIDGLSHFSAEQVDSLEAYLNARLLPGLLVPSPQVAAQRKEVHSVETKEYQLVETENRTTQEEKSLLQSAGYWLYGAAGTALLLGGGFVAWLCRKRLGIKGSYVAVSTVEKVLEEFVTEARPVEIPFTVGTETYSSAKGDRLLNGDNTDGGGLNEVSSFSGLGLPVQENLLLADFLVRNVTGENYGGYIGNYALERQKTDYLNDLENRIGPIINMTEEEAWSSRFSTEPKFYSSTDERVGDDEDTLFSNSNLFAQENDWGMKTKPKKRRQKESTQRNA